jgi:hypothetical protein
MLSETSKQQLPSRHRAMPAAFVLGLSFNPTEDSTLHTHCCVENVEEKVKLASINLLTD